MDATSGERRKSRPRSRNPQILRKTGYKNVLSTRLVGSLARHLVLSGNLATFCNCFVPLSRFVSVLLIEVDLFLLDVSGVLENMPLSRKN